VAIVTMKEEQEEGEKAKKVGKNCEDGEVPRMIALQGKMELEFIKNAKKKGKFQLIETNIATLTSIGIFYFMFVFFHSRL